MTTKEDPETKRAKAEARQLLSLLKDYLQLEAVAKLTVAISLGIALVVLFVLLFAGVFCLAMSLSVLLSRLLHSFAGGYALTGLLLIALGVVFWMARKSLLENFVMRAVAKVVTNVVKRAKKELTDDNNPTTIANK